jgi:hypothetical protein|tara:strand:- start:64 stop:222 length:159 start_codon:yes stop_codon:yes gene_type:complete
MAKRDQQTTINLHKGIKKQLEGYYAAGNYDSWDHFMRDMLKLIKEYVKKGEA